MTEFLEERKDLLYELFTEAIEDGALVNAIREGESSEPIIREAIFHLLESEA